MAVNTNSKHSKTGKDIVDEFIKVRKSKRMSQAEVAKKADLHQAAVGRIENKSTDPRLETFMKMLNSIGYTLAIVPAYQDVEHTVLLEISTVLDSLDEDDLKRVKAYADAIQELEIKKKKDAFGKIMSMARPSSVGDDYKAVLEEKLIRKYEGLD